MRSRLVAGAVIVLVIVVVLVARRRPHPKSTPQRADSAIVQPRSPAAATAAAPTPPASQKQLATDLITLGVTPARAKQYFTMVVGPLPGVTAPPGQRDRSDFDGTLAVGYLTEVWDSLTTEQRSAAERLIHPSGRVPGGQRSSLPAPESMIRAVAYTRTTASPAYDYNTIASDANKALSSILGQPAVRFTLDTDYAPALAGEYAHTWSWFISPDHPDQSWKDVIYPSGCEITIHDMRFSELSFTDARAVVTHEMFHCYQQRVVVSASGWWSVHAWILEGEPAWVMQAVVPDVSAQTMDSTWIPYVTRPTTPFVVRSYDAAGIYWHLADLAGAAVVWPRLLPMVSAGMGGVSTPANDINAFNVLTAGHELTYFSDWGASYFETAQKDPWEMPARLPLSLDAPAPTDVTLTAGSIQMLSPAAPYLSEMFKLTGTTDIAIVSLLTGYGRLHDNDFKVDDVLDVSAPLALCLKQGGCKCPDGSPGASLFTKAATAPLSLGINGGDKTTQVVIVGESLDKFCKQPDPPTPPGPPGGGGGGAPRSGMISGDTLGSPPQGEARGDTHIVTLDGLHYDFQDVGEFVLAKSRKEDFLVQVRMVPVRGSNTVSMSQAVATKLDGHRVTITVENANEVLRVDGKEVFGPPPAPLRGAVLCTETMFGPSCQLNWPDGTIVRATQVERFALNVALQPARARLGTLVGLLGDGNGSTANDLIGVDGAKLGTSPSQQDVNHSLAKAWRVEPGKSLFDYLPGQSSRTFADTTFPHADAGRLANRDSAEKVCRQEGITDNALLDDCILDLAVTNNFAFASVYSHAQRVSDAQAALRPTAMAGVLRTLYMDGTITDKSQQPVFTFAVKDSDVVWIDSTGCQDGNGSIRLDALWHLRSDTTSTWDMGRDDAIFEKSGDPTRVPACRAGRFKVMAGTIGLLANPLKDGLGAFHIPVRFVRHDRVRAITYGTTVDGEIENPGVQDIYTFIGHSGDVIRISGDGCDLGPMSTYIRLPGAYADQGPACSGGDFTLPPKPATAPPDSTVQFIINWARPAGPAKYHFVFKGVPAK